MATKYSLALTTSPQIAGAPGGPSGSNFALLTFQTAPTAGTLTVETKLVGSANWQTIATGISLTSGEAQFTYSGAVGPVRLTFVGLVGGATPELWVTQNIGQATSAAISAPSGAIPAGGVQTVQISSLGAWTPVTAFLKSTSGTRKIEISWNGTEFVELDYDTNVTALLAAAIAAPVTQIRFTAASGDTFKVIA